MTGQFSNPTPDEARRALTVAERAAIATPADRTRLERGLITIGVAVGGLILALRFTVGEPGAPSWFRGGGLAVVMALYLVALAVAIVTMRRAKATPRGFSVRYNTGLFATMAIYVVYVIVSSAQGEHAVPWMWTVLAALAAVTPALLAAHAISRLALR